jgi:hypothetical protein
MSEQKKSVESMLHYSVVLRSQMSFALHSLATRFIAVTKYVTEQRVAPFDCDRCAKPKRLGIIPK